MGNITIGMIILAIVRLRGFFVLDGIPRLWDYYKIKKHLKIFSSGAFLYWYRLLLVNHRIENV